MEIFRKIQPQSFKIVQSHLRWICHENMFEQKSFKVISTTCYQWMTIWVKNDEWLSVICVCVCGGLSSPGVRNKVGLWLDSSIWRSLAAGSKRDIQMVSLLIGDHPPNLHSCNTVQIETHWMQARRKKENIEATLKIYIKTRSKRYWSNVRGWKPLRRLLQQNMSIQRTRKIVPTMEQLIGNNQLLRWISANYETNQCDKADIVYN